MFRPIPLFLTAAILLAGCSGARDPWGCAGLNIASLPFAMFGSEPGGFESCQPAQPTPSPTAEDR